MSPRKYTLGVREAGVEETRRRILEAARAMIVETGFHRASMADVARRADVTRATIYNHFGSKIGLLEAVMTTALVSAGLERIIPLLALPDAREAFEASTRESTRMWAAESELFRKVIGLAAVDPEAHEVVEKRDAERKSAMAMLARRLDEQGYLRPGVSHHDAEAVLVLLTSFPTFDSLYTEGKRSPDEVSRLLIDLAGTVLVR